MKTIASLPSSIVLSIGTIFLSCWHLGFPSLMQLPPATWPIPYTSAFCLVLSGLSFISFRSVSRFLLSKIFGFTIFFLGFQRVMELLLPVDYRLNRMLCNAHFCPLNSQMVLAAAIGYMLVGILFMYWSKNNNSKLNKIVTLFISVPVIFLGSIGIFIGLLSVEYKFSNPFLHFYTAAGLFFTGLGFVIAKFYVHRVEQITKIS